jgi:hypothetical protein
MRQRAVARSCARPFAYDRAFAAGGLAHAFFGFARIATSLRDSRATVDGGWAWFQAV